MTVTTRSNSTEILTKLHIIVLGSLEDLSLFLCLIKTRTGVLREEVVLDVDSCPSLSGLRHF